VKLLLLFLLSPIAAQAGEEPVTCNSATYRNFLGELGEDLFKASANLCLDNLRRESVKKTEGSSAPVAFTFHSVAASELPTGCESGDLEAMKRALRLQLANCSAASPARLKETRKFGCKTFTRQEWCNDANQKMLALAEAAPTFAAYSANVKQEFDWVASDGWGSGAKCEGKTQFTAYHGPPPIEASPVPTPEFSYPVYSTPKDLVNPEPGEPGCGRKSCRKLANGSLEPYPDRNEIDNNGALKGQGAELAYVKDPLDVAFLMVEGSGSMNLHQPDGSVKFTRLNYDNSNARTNNMLGRVLLCVGARPTDYGSMTGIKAYVAAHPERRSAIMALDQSYVFFRAEAADKGPYGVDDIPITGRHSFATDRKIIPTGSVIMFHTQLPGGRKNGDCSEISSLGVAQDVGGALNGPHVDWYLGEGEDAQAQANDVNQCGSLFLALPKNSGTAVPGCDLR
jgi:membrane-bound lytic murein transglycosylase